MKMINTKGKVQQREERLRDHIRRCDIKVSHEKEEVKALTKGGELTLLGIRNKGKGPMNRPK